MKKTKVNVKVINAFNDSEDEFKEYEKDDLIKDMPYSRFLFLQSKGFVEEYKEPIVEEKKSEDK